MPAKDKEEAKKPEEEVKTPEEEMKEAAGKAKAEAKEDIKSEDKTGSEDFKKAMEEKDMQIEGLEGKLDSLQDSLDSALEEMALKGGPPSIEEEPIAPLTKEGAGEEELKAEGSLSKKEEVGQIPPAEGTENIEGKLEEAIEEDQKFRENILLREEMRDLKDELKDALEIHPAADPNEVLRDIEDGTEEDNPNQVEVLAKASADKRQELVEKIKTESEEDFRAKLKKEQEGEISVPQSPGVPPVPITPHAKSQETAHPLQEDAEWGDALHKAKQEFVEGGGA